MVDLLALLPTFVVAVVLISASPGPAMALILRRAASHGWRAAVPTVLGLETGLYVWALFAAAGFAALVAASEVTFLVLRIVGAVVLIYLGARAWRAAWRLRRDGAALGDATDDAPADGSRRWWWAFSEGTMVQLANPKAAVFMIAFYPQFVPTDLPLFTTTAGLALLQVLMETTLYLALAGCVGRTKSWFARPALRSRLDVISGGVLIGLGIRIAASSH